MNESVVKELKKYIFFSSIGEFIREIGGLIILIILLVIFITNISGILDMIRSEDNILCDSIVSSFWYCTLLSCRIGTKKNYSKIRGRGRIK